jgi:hypothetical protein
MYLTTPYTVRSSTRFYPFSEPQDGLNPEDINKDGWVALMRVKDPNGEWKVSAKDSRALARREPSETGGVYYKLYTEGMIKNYKGGQVKMAPAAQGLDFNRNYPANWQPESVQSGSGPYPLSEPETKCVAEFLLDTKNITGVMSYHTFTGILLRPPCTRRDEKVPPKDLATFEALAKLGGEITGYIPMTVMDLNENKPSCGNLKDFMYEFQGIYIFTAELWDVAGHAGAKNHATDFLRNKTEDDDVAVLKWMDANGVDGFIDWTPFEHPQLGPVEIGGYKFKFLVQNPPPRFLQAECHKNCMFTLKQAGMSPLVRINSLTATPLGDSVYRVDAEVENVGFLPTNISEQAKIMRVAKPVTAVISCGDGATLISAESRQSLDHIEGRSATMANLFGAIAAPTVKTATWIVKAVEGKKPEITVQVSSPKAGRDSKSIALA